MNPKLKQALASESVQAPLRWYAGREPREQRALRVLSVVLAGALLWQAVWVPVRDARNRNQAAYLAALSDVAWMRAHAEEAAAKPDALEDDAPVLTSVAASAQRQGITLQHVEPAQDGSLRITLESVPFTRLVSWLEALEAEHGIRADYAALERASAPGQVSASLTLRR